MPTAKNVGEPCAGEPHARIEVAAGGNRASRQCRTALAPPADPYLWWGAVSTGGRDTGLAPLWQPSLPGRSRGQGGSARPDERP